MTVKTIKIQEELIVKLKKGESSAYNYIYKTVYPSVLNHIKLNGGDESQALDIFQDAMVVLYKKVNDSSFVLNCQIKTFIFSICRNLWLNELKTKFIYVDEIDEDLDYCELEIDEINDAEQMRNKAKMLYESLMRLGEPCSTILKKFYVENLSMTEIADLMNYTNSDNAKNQKYKCLMRLKKIFFRQIKND